MTRDNPNYCKVSNWTLVHELIKAALKARQALRLEGDAIDKGVAIAHLDVALMHVDEAHQLAEKHSAVVREFDEEKSRGDDTNGDSAVPFISENEDDDAPNGVAGIWISMCEYVDLTKEED